MKLYTVSIEFEYAVMAENKQEAIECADDVLRDTFDSTYNTDVIEVKKCKQINQPLMPLNWNENSLVYNSDDLNFHEAWKVCDNNPENIELKKKQGKLFE